MIPSNLNDNNNDIPELIEINDEQLMPEFNWPIPNNELVESRQRQRRVRISARRMRRLIQINPQITSRLVFQCRRCRYRNLIHATQYLIKPE